MRKRPGYSLVECVVAIGLIAATFTIVAVATAGMQRAIGRIRADAETELALERLAVQLRADAHEAVEAEPSAPGADGSPGLLRLTLGETRSIDYAIAAKRIERRVRRGGAVVHRETYRLPDTSGVHWELSGGSSAPVVILRIDPAAPGSADSIAGHGMEIQAAVGLLQPPPAGDKP